MMVISQSGKVTMPFERMTWVIDGGSDGIRIGRMKHHWITAYPVTGDIDSEDYTVMASYRSEETANRAYMDMITAYDKGFTKVFRLEAES